MKGVRFLLVFCMVMVDAVSSHKVKPAASGCSNCRDGRDGKDGRDGRDGISVCANQAHQRPLIHLDGTAPVNVDIKAGTNIDVWSTTAPIGYVTGGMKYSQGLITVPMNGVYFVYCQVYYNSQKFGGRHRIFVNNQGVSLVELKTNPTVGSLYTGLPVKLNAGDKLSCRLSVYDSPVYRETQHTFFGAYLL